MRMEVWLPLRVRMCRDPEPGPRPTRLDQWRFLYTKLPYQALIPIGDLGVLMQETLFDSDLPRGPVLLTESLDADLDQDFEIVSWLRASIPWTSLVVMVEDLEEADPFGRRLTELSRAGALVIPRKAAMAGGFRTGLCGAMRPELDLAPWLARALPRWPAPQRANAVEQFLQGFNYNPYAGIPAGPIGKLPSRTVVWSQIGRATKGALQIQRRQGRAWRTVALDAGYSNLKALDRAVVRAFGLSRNDIVGTVGWEWLLWRFLCGLGKGRTRNWAC